MQTVVMWRTAMAMLTAVAAVHVASTAAAAAPTAELPPPTGLRVEHLAVGDNGAGVDVVVSTMRPRFSFLPHTGLDVLW